MQFPRQGMLKRILHLWRCRLTAVFSVYRVLMRTLGKIPVLSLYYLTSRLI